MCLSEIQIYRFIYIDKPELTHLTLNLENLKFGIPNEVGLGS